MGRFFQIFYQLTSPDMLIDAHCHLTDPRFINAAGPTRLPFLLAHLKSLGFTGFVFGGVDAKDWLQQLILQSQHPEFFWGTCFGLHPEKVTEEFETQIERLVGREFAGRFLALGETGLDFRQKVLGVNPDRQRDLQLDCFQAHLELSSFLKKPLVLHVVRAFPEVERCLLTISHSGSGLVHAFTGSWEEADFYLKQGFCISVGGRVTDSRAWRLHEAVRKIPADLLMIESDSPDQAPRGWQGELNSPESLFLVAQAVASLRGSSAEDILLSSALNVSRLFA